MRKIQNLEKRAVASAERSSWALEVATAIFVVPVYELLKRHLINLNGMHAEHMKGQAPIRHVRLNDNVHGYCPVVRLQLLDDQLHLAMEPLSSSACHGYSIQAENPTFASSA